MQAYRFRFYFLFVTVIIFVKMVLSSTGAAHLHDYWLARSDEMPDFSHIVSAEDESALAARVDLSKDT